MQVAKKNGKHDIPVIFPWTGQKRNIPKLRQPPPPRVPKKKYVSLAERRQIVAHDHCYHTTASSANAFDTHPASSGSTFLSSVSDFIKLYSDASVNTSYSESSALVSTTDKKISEKSCQTTFDKEMSEKSCQTDCLVTAFRIEQIANDNKLVHFYTGFEDYEKLMICYKFLGPCVSQLSYWKKGVGERDLLETRGAPRLLTPLNEFFLVLCRMRLGLLEQDLAFRFGISQPTVSRICITWINAMYSKFKEVSIWPTRQQVDAKMPASFADYPTTRVVIDATEIFIEQPSSPVAQQQTFSSYKNHNTLKVLIGITPSGAISFVSKLYGGSTSDRELTIQSGILELLEPGDSVMADKGFTIADLLSARGVSLNMPPMKTDKQLTEKELLETRRIASVRIHVERAIRRIKAFRILETIPNCMAGIADQLFFVCSFLTNFQKPLV